VAALGRARSPPVDLRPKDVFQQLPPEGRPAWRRLPNEDRETTVDKMRPDDDASKTESSTQAQRGPANRKANITGGRLVDNEAYFTDEVNEDAEECLAAPVHETSHPDERTDLIVDTSARRGIEDKQALPDQRAASRGSHSDKKRGQYALDWPLRDPRVRSLVSFPSGQALLAHRSRGRRRHPR